MSDNTKIVIRTARDQDVFAVTEIGAEAFCLTEPQKSRKRFSAD